MVAVPQGCPCPSMGHPWAAVPVPAYLCELWGGQYSSLELNMEGEKRQTLCM